MMTKQMKRTGSACVSVTLQELLQLSRSAKQLSLSSLPKKNMQTGQNMSKLFGRGMEFAESRRYHIGDDIRNIDWRVTARTGKAHTKLYTVDKERQFLLCVDLDTHMHFATKGVFKSVQAALMSGLLAWNAVQEGNRVGGIVFNQKFLHQFRPASGKKGILSFLQCVADIDLMPKTQKEQVNPSLELAIANIEQTTSPGSFIFVISDFRQMTHKTRDSLLKLSKQNDLCLCFVYDPFEFELPKIGCLPLNSPQGEKSLNASDSKGAKEYQIQFENRKAAVKSLANHRNIYFIECSTEDDYFSVLKKHFS